MDFLDKLGIKEADAREILAYNRECGEAIRELSREYMSFAPKAFLKPYAEGERAITVPARCVFGQGQGSGRRKTALYGRTPFLAALRTFRPGAVSKHGNSGRDLLGYHERYCL